ncbi:TlpA disulfide reductase family protein [Flavobacteriaceae sp. LMIT009]
MKLRKPKASNIIFFVVIALLIIPQTRKPIQVALNKVIAVFGPLIIDEGKRSVFEYSSWRLEGLNGEQINFKDLEGEVVLLNFWATWCPPCIAELPHIQELSKEYGNRIKIVLVSGESLNKVSSYFDKKGYDLNSYHPLESYPKGLNISSIPRTFLIDEQGKIVIDKTGAANWNSNKVRKLIDDLLK